MARHTPTVHTDGEAAADRLPEPDAPGGVDWAELLRAVQGNQVLLATVVEAALTEIPCLMEAISTAIAQRDAKRLRLSAHNLKGVIRYFGITPAFETAYQLETAAREGRLEDGPSILARLGPQIARITASLAGQGPSQNKLTI
jgi:HPt (histidine-containing phosphotransfer) domain-containing protein